MLSGIGRLSARRRERRGTFRIGSARRRCRRGTSCSRRVGALDGARRSFRAGRGPARLDGRSADAAPTPVLSVACVIRRLRPCPLSQVGSALATLFCVREPVQEIAGGNPARPAFLDGRVSGRRRSAGAAARIGGGVAEPARSGEPGGVPVERREPGPGPAVLDREEGVGEVGCPATGRCSATCSSRSSRSPSASTPKRPRRAWATSGRRVVSRKWTWSWSATTGASSPSRSS